MPVSSISGMNSWGLYLASAVALVLVLAPQLSALTASSREAADWRYADGLREALDSLQPGVAMNFTFASPMALDPVRLAGHQLLCDYGGGALTFSSRWYLSNVTITPNSRYLLRLSGEQVLVRQVG